MIVLLHTLFSILKRIDMLSQSGRFHLEQGYTGKPKRSSICATGSPKKHRSRHTPGRGKPAYVCRDPDYTSLLRTGKPCFYL